MSFLSHAGRYLLVAALVAGLTFDAHAGESLEFIGFDDASMSEEAWEGLQEIFSGQVFRTAFPTSLIEARQAGLSPDELGYDPSTAEGAFYSSGRLPSPPNRDVPAGTGLGQSLFERNGATLMNGNCLSCHSGVVNGKVVAGLGNNAIMSDSRLSNGRSLGPSTFALLGKLESDAEKAEVAMVMNNIKVKSTTKPEVSSRGDHYGPFAVWAFGAHLVDPKNRGLDTSLEETDLTRLLKETVVPAVDPMPWWLMKYKERDYWYSDGGPADAAHFSLNFASAYDGANEDHAAHVASTAKALAFARETQSPIYPGALDAELVEFGADLFHGRVAPENPAAFKACFECHGSYTKKSRTPDFSQPGSWSVDYDGSTELKKVRTDRAYNEVLQTFRPIADHINGLMDYHVKQETPELAPQEEYPEGKGYVAPPLVGVWASAPYFHNGSVPTLDTVLNSELRPEIWSRPADFHTYDLERVGMAYEVVDREGYESSAAAAAESPSNAKAAIDHMFLYDTTGHGHGNTGHTFGDTLTTQERAAIIEFLKSLSGPDM